MSDQQKSGIPYQVILMLVIVLGVIVAGFLVFPKTQEERDRMLARLGTTNHGILVQPPLSLQTLTVNDASGNPWILSEQPRKWRLLIPGGSRCDDACQQRLYITRQMHIRLGKYTHRVQRIYLNLETAMDEELVARLGDEHPYLQLMQGNAEQFLELLASRDLPWSGQRPWAGTPDQGTMRALVVDQNGYAMMYYQDQHSGNQMLEDFNHLLKYSPE